MADPKLDISADDIDRALSHALMHSRLGEIFIKGVNDYIQRLPTGYDSPVKKAVEAEAARIVARLVAARATEIEIEVRKQIDDAMVKNAVGRALERFMKALE